MQLSFNLEPGGGSNLFDSKLFHSGINYHKRVYIQCTVLAEITVRQEKILIKHSQNTRKNQILENFRKYKCNYTNIRLIIIGSIRISASYRSHAILQQLVDLGNFWYSSLLHKIEAD